MPDIELELQIQMLLLQKLCKTIECKSANATMANVAMWSKQLENNWDTYMKYKAECSDKSLSCYGRIYLTQHNAWKAYLTAHCLLGEIRQRLQPVYKNIDHIDNEYTDSDDD